MYEWWTGLEWNGGLCLEKVNNEKQEQLQLSWGKLSCNICMYLYIASILLVSLTNPLPSGTTWCGLSRANAVPSVGSLSRKMVPLQGERAHPLKIFV